MTYWYQIFSMRGQFNLPTENVSEFVLWWHQGFLIDKYLTASSMAVFFLCLKNLRILTLYFPAFGLLFETITKSKMNLIFFLILSVIFLMAFVFSGHLLYGPHLFLYSTVGRGAQSLYRMLFGEFNFSDLYAANSSFVTILFFFVYVIFGFLILQNLLISILSITYDALRYKQGPDSLAQARMLSQDNNAYFAQWANLLLCRLDKGDQTGQSENAELEEKDAIDQEGKRTEKKDIKTIFKVNKAKLFQKKSMKSKEEIENRLNQIKQDMKQQKKREYIDRIIRFSGEFDKKSVKKAQNSVIYLIFIVVFVAMVFAQLKITESGSTVIGLKQYISQQQFQNERQYFPMDPELAANIAGSDQGTFTYPLISLSDVYSLSMVVDWIQGGLISLAYPSLDPPTILRNNYFFGMNRVRVTLRLVEMEQNMEESTNSTIKFFREVDKIGPPVHPSELTGDFIGPHSGREYKYTEPETSKSFEYEGGFVIYFPSDLESTQNIISDMILDNLFNQNLAQIGFEFVTYNPNHQKYVLSSFQFIQCKSGYIYHSFSNKAIRLDFYSTKEDKLRAVIELIYLIFLCYYTLIEIVDFVSLWEKMVRIVIAHDLIIIGCCQQHSISVRKFRRL